MLRDAQRLMIEDRPLIHLFSGVGYSAAHGYVRDTGFELPGSLQRAHYRQWLALPADVSASTLNPRRWANRQIPGA